VRYSPDVMRMVEKSLLLQVLDQTWKDHLLTLDHLRQGIGLRSYAQRDPLNEYKTEAFSLFEKMLDQLRENVTSVLCTIELQINQPSDVPMPQGPREMHETRTDPALGGPDGEVESTSRRAFDPNDSSTWGKVSRNAVCPCGSGKKYKPCHGRLS
jgi:preprotein translocase subunit SecA